MNLFEHGIGTENSHYRAHVSSDRKMYIFETEEARCLVESGEYRNANAYINGQLTAEGCLVPLDAMTTCSALDIPIRLWVKNRMDAKRGLQQKGDAAEDIVAQMFANGYLPQIGDSVVQYFWDDGNESKSMQLSGVDMTVNGWNIEVKYDARCGDGRGSTGNFYLQTHERRLR